MFHSKLEFLKFFTGKFSFCDLVGPLTSKRTFHFDSQLRVPWKPGSVLEVGRRADTQAVYADSHRPRALE